MLELWSMLTFVTHHHSLCGQLYSHNNVSAKVQMDSLDFREAYDLDRDVLQVCEGLC